MPSSICRDACGLGGPSPLAYPAQALGFLAPALFPQWPRVLSHPPAPWEEELFLGLVLGGPQQGRWPGMASVCTACPSLTRGRQVLKQVCALPDTLPAGDGACVFSPRI